MNALGLIGQKLSQRKWVLITATALALAGPAGPSFSLPLIDTLASAGPRGTFGAPTTMPRAFSLVSMALYMITTLVSLPDLAFPWSWHQLPLLEAICTSNQTYLSRSPTPEPGRQ
jgi:hypothetical protein